MALISDGSTYHPDHGTFEKGLFCKKYRDHSEDFDSYSDTFIRRLEHHIQKVFGIKVKTIQEEATESGNDAKYTEIFDLCRATVLKHSEGSYPRISALLARYNSAKLMGGIFFLATLGFWVRTASYLELKYLGWIIVLPFRVLLKFLALWIFTGEGRVKLEFFYWLFEGFLAIVLLFFGYYKTPQDNSEVFWISFGNYCVSAILCPIFFHLYHVLFRYYRNTIIYGFYEYAVTREKSVESKDREN